MLATIGRTDEPRRFLRTLAAQPYRDFRLIVADQNDDERLAPVLAEFEGGFPILHVSSKPGLSRARNAALRHATADVVAFPDDDCWYSPDLLERVAGFFAAHPDRDGLCGRSVDDEGNPSAGRPDREAGDMTLFNLWRRVASYLLFLRQSSVELVGPFDETLGVGAPTLWRAGEDLDYVARCVRAGLSVYYDPAFGVYHPPKRERASSPDPRQGFEYGAGFGRALRKSGLPSWFGAYQSARSFVASGVSLLAGRPGRARFYWAVGNGRLRGWRSASTSS